MTQKLAAAASGVVKRVDAVGRASAGNPVAVAQVALVCTLTASAGAVLIGWMAGGTDASLRVPLLVMGICVIAVGMTLNKGATAITLAVLIVGILVAPREYLLRIAHMVSHSAAPFEQYAKKYEGEEQVAIGPNKDQFAKQVLDVLEQRGVKLTPDVQKAIGRAVGVASFFRDRLSYTLTVRRQ
jgi:hypothetical protein